MNRFAAHSHMFLMGFYLRLRHPLYFTMPSSQIYVLHLCLKLLKILKPQKINFFLLEGSLLGAIRQESFAGRPSDIDFGIKEDELQKLLDAFPLLIKSGIKTIKKEVNNKIEKIQILFPCILVDIAVYRKRNVGKNEMWVGEIYKDIAEKINGVAFPITDLENLITVKAYGKNFFSPANPEIYLEKIYGKNWKVPDKKQFFWKKKIN